MKLKEKVAYILENFPDTKNSDNLLVIRYINYFHFPIILDLSKIPDLPSFECITRIRRKFQEAGEYKADVIVTELRDKKKHRIKEFMRNFWNKF